MNTLEAKSYILKLIKVKYGSQYKFAKILKEDRSHVNVRINSLDAKDNKHKVRYLRKLGINAEEFREIIVK